MIAKHISSDTSCDTYYWHQERLSLAVIALHFIENLLNFNRFPSA